MPNKDVMHVIMKKYGNKRHMGILDTPDFSVPRERTGRAFGCRANGGRVANCLKYYNRSFSSLDRMLRSGGFVKILDVLFTRGFPDVI